MIRICSIGGCGCTTIFCKLIKNKIDATKEHFLYSELVNINRLIDLYNNGVVISDKYKTEDICVYVYNDPILAMISRIRRGMIYKHSSLIKDKNSDLYLLINDIKENFKNRRHLFKNDKVKDRQNALNVWKDILKVIVQDCIKHKRDTYGVLEHFESFYMHKTKASIFIDPFRHKNDFARLNTFLNTNIFQINVGNRCSDYTFLYDISPFAHEFITFYQGIDRKICEMIDSTR